MNPPIKPMLAKAVAGIPDREDVLFEPKWDGFRCIVFRDGDEILLGSRNEKPLTRYFPELLAPLLEMLPDKVVIDGELIVATDNHLDFDALQQRIHPAESRVALLSQSTPAQFLAFDLLAIGDRDMRPAPFSERRTALVDALGDVKPPIHLTRVTADKAEAAQWFIDFEGAGLDGLIAKPTDDPYLENKRAQLKVKHVRTADAVVAGYRWHKDGKGVGSLLLGLHDDEGELHHVGVAASFTAKRRAELVEELAPLTSGALDSHPWKHWGTVKPVEAVRPTETAKPGETVKPDETVRMPGAPNRWSGKKDHSWVPLRIEQVVEVKYNATLNARFREVTRFLRWRPDKIPDQCTFDQLDEPIPVGLDTVLTSKAPK